MTPYSGPFQCHPEAEVEYPPPELHLLDQTYDPDPVVRVLNHEHAKTKVHFGICFHEAADKLYIFSFRQSWFYKSRFDLTEPESECGYGWVEGTDRMIASFNSGLEMANSTTRIAPGLARPERAFSGSGSNRRFRSRVELIQLCKDEGKVV